MIPFKDIRNGYTVFLLNRKGPEYIEAETIAVSAPRVRTVAEMAGGIGMVIDLTVRANDEERSFTVGADDARCSGGDFFMATDREAIANEVKAMRRTSEDAIFAVEKHKQTVERCNAIIEEMGPQYGGTGETDREVKALRGEIAELKEMMLTLTKGGQQ